MFFQNRQDWFRQVPKIALWCIFGSLGYTWACPMMHKELYNDTF